MLIFVEEGIELKTALSVIFYSREATVYGKVISKAIEQNQNLIYILPKHPEDWVSMQSIVSLGKEWLRMTKFKPLKALRIQLYNRKGSPEIKKIVPNLIMEICSELVTFIPKESVPRKALAADTLEPGSGAKRQKIKVSNDASINQLKLQKSYLDWIPDIPNRDELKPNTLEAIMEANKSLLIKDEFYGRKFRNEKI
jgi:hypothetical protein